MFADNAARPMSALSASMRKLFSSSFCVSSRPFLQSLLSGRPLHPSFSCTSPSSSIRYSARTSRSGSSSSGSVSCITHSSLSLSRRFYYPTFSDDLVPQDSPPTSRFQTSGNPALRESVITGYALAPLFAERRVVCRLGWRLRSRYQQEVVKSPQFTTSNHNSQRDDGAWSLDRIRHVRPAVRRCLAAFYDTLEENIVLGSLQSTRDMLLFRKGLGYSPRMKEDDGRRYERRGRGGREAAAASSSSTASSSMTLSTRKEVRVGGSSYTIGPQHAACTAMQPVVAAHILMDVSFADASVSRDAALEYGALLQSYLLQLEEEHHGGGAGGRSSSDNNEEAAGPLTTQNTDLQRGNNSNHNNNSDTCSTVEKEEETEAEVVEARCRACAAALREECGVFYCEVPQAPDESDHLFTALHGREVSAEEEARILNKWESREGEEEVEGGEGRA